MCIGNEKIEKVTNTWRKYYEKEEEETEEEERSAYDSGIQIGGSHKKKRSNQNKPGKYNRRRMANNAGTSASARRGRKLRIQDVKLPK